MGCRRYSPCMDPLTNPSLSASWPVCCSVWVKSTTKLPTSTPPHTSDSVKRLKSQKTSLLALTEKRERKLLCGQREVIKNQTSTYQAIVLHPRIREKQRRTIPHQAKSKPISRERNTASKILRRRSLCPHVFSSPLRGLSRSCFCSCRRGLRQTGVCEGPRWSGHPAGRGAPTMPCTADLRCTALGRHSRRGNR